MESLSLLIVEDNQTDIEILLDCFAITGINCDLNIVQDGEEALKYLNKEDEYSKARTPSIVILDISLPKLSGFDVLKEIKEKEDLKHIPVIIISGSELTEDIRSSYGYLASSYISKSIDKEEFLNKIKAFKNYWLETVRLTENI